MFDGRHDPHGCMQVAGTKRVLGQNTVQFELMMLKHMTCDTCLRSDAALQR